MEEKKQVPQIRFKGYVDVWEQRKLGDVLEVIKDGTHGTHQDAEDGPFLLSAKNIKNGVIIWDETDRKISEDEYEKIHSKFKLQNNDVLLTIVGSIGETAILKDISGITFQRSVAFIRPSEELSSEFLYSEIQTPKFQKELDCRKSTSAQPGIYLGDLSEIPFVYSKNEDEQKKIGEYFSNIDNLITLHQRKYDKLVNIKKSMLEKMFPKNGRDVPEIRFKGFTDAWEQRKWIDVVDISTEMVNPTTGEYDNMPHIAPGNIESFTGRILDNVKTVKEEQLISGKFRFRPDDVVYGKINPQLGKYFYATVNGLTSADAYVFNGKNGLKQKFLFALLQTNDFFKYSVSVSKRSGMPKINRDELNAYSFLMPSEEEQDKIGSYLLQMDNLITLHQRKLEKLKNIKKSMLDKMFV